MRTRLATLLWSCCIAAEAHVGSPNVIFEGQAGQYPVRVVIRPPQVVPGLAEITVRGPAEPDLRVTVLPVFWNAGRKGAPPPDEAHLVRGETNLYSAQLWLMKPGAYSMDVTVEGPGGKGTLIVPVNAMATNTRPMSRGYGLTLSALGLVLFLGGVKIVGAIFGQSGLDPGALPTRKDRWRGRAAMVVAAAVLSLMGFGGKKWWDFEDRNYRNNSLYKPFPVSAQVRTEREEHILSIAVDASERRGQWTPLLSDHGKMMHLFLVHAKREDAFAHLHPVHRSGAEFEAALPPLPAGRYHLYADVTHEDGFAETLAATVEVPPASSGMKALWLGNSAEPLCSAAVAQRLATNLFFPPDRDDSWHWDSGVRTAQPSGSFSPDADQRVAELSGGYKMIWENAGPLVENRDASLRFKLLAPGNQPAVIEPYLGMVGHAVVRRQDGAVFAHIHPAGTFSMAAQEFFVNGKRSKNSTSAWQPGESSAGEPSLGRLLQHSHTNSVGWVEEVSFPYAFPQLGLYRLWIQMKCEGRILTGVFDATVASAK